MKNAGKFVIWSILCIAVFALAAITPAFANDAPAARLEGVAIEPADSTDISNTSINELPRMDFVAPQVTGTEEKTSAVEKKPGKTPISKNPKLSNKIREYWLNIHGEDQGSPVVEKNKENAVQTEAVTPAEPEIKAQKIEEKTRVAVETPEDVSDAQEKTEEKTQISKDSKLPKKIHDYWTNIHTEKKATSPEEKNKILKSKAETKDDRFAPAPIVTTSPQTSAPIIVQKKSSTLALFSGALEKMAKRREYRMAEAKRLNVVLPSQGGSFEKLPQSICRLQSTIQDILMRNGAGVAVSMIFKGHFTGTSDNLKRSRK